MSQQIPPALTHRSWCSTSADVKTPASLSILKRLRVIRRLQNLTNQSEIHLTFRKEAESGKSQQRLKRQLSPLMRSWGKCLCHCAIWILVLNLHLKLIAGKEKGALEKPKRNETQQPAPAGCSSSSCSASGSTLLCCDVAGRETVPSVSLAAFLFCACACVFCVSPPPPLHVRCSHCLPPSSLPCVRLTYPTGCIFTHAGRKAALTADVEPPAGEIQLNHNRGAKLHRCALNVTTVSAQLTFVTIFQKDVMRVVILHVYVTSNVLSVP